MIERREYAEASFPRGGGAKEIIEQESKKGRKVDALALRGEEGRDKLRKATGRCK